MPGRALAIETSGAWHYNRLAQPYERRVLSQPRRSVTPFAPRASRDHAPAGRRLAGFAGVLLQSARSAIFDRVRARVRAERVDLRAQPAVELHLRRARSAVGESLRQWPGRRISARIHARLLGFAT